MEAVPRLPMLKVSIKDNQEFAGAEWIDGAIDGNKEILQQNIAEELNRHIRENYSDNPEKYKDCISNFLELQLSAYKAIAAPDFEGLNTLKKYYGQLHYMQSRFPFTGENSLNVSFSWGDAFTGMCTQQSSFVFEQVAIAFNLGSIHSYLGSLDNRTSEEGTKVSCVHFQCAAGFFQYLADHLDTTLSLDTSQFMLKIFINAMLGQGQECLLEKSMQDNRKHSIISKISQQVVDYYQLTLNGLNQPEAKDLMGDDNRIWTRLLTFKIAFYAAITKYYLGCDDWEQEKYGQGLAFFSAALDSYNEAVKAAKNLKGEFKIKADDALKYSADVFGGKHNSAKKDNDFIYHDRVPDKAMLPEVKGASLVKALPFDPSNSAVTGPDIFNKLVPMEAHLAASTYSEEKAKLLRPIIEEVDEKNSILEQYKRAIELDPGKLVNADDEDRLDLSLVEHCAALSVDQSPIQELSKAMKELSNVYMDIETVVSETVNLMEDEETETRQVKDVCGKSIDSSEEVDEVRKELEICADVHKKAGKMNDDLHTAMRIHISNLKTVSEGLDALKRECKFQNYSELISDDDKEVINLVQKLCSKVAEMEQQRQTLVAQLRSQLEEDDVTSSLMTKPGVDSEDLFQEELKKHDTLVGYIRQNLTAQENILTAVTEANVRYTKIKKTVEVHKEKVKQKCDSLLLSCTGYTEAVTRCKEGYDFFKELLDKVKDLHTSMVELNDKNSKLRKQILDKHEAKKPPPRPSAPKPKTTKPTPAPAASKPGTSLFSTEELAAMADDMDEFNDPAFLRYLQMSGGLPEGVSTPGAVGSTAAIRPHLSNPNPGISSRRLPTSVGLGYHNPHTTQGYNPQVNINLPPRAGVHPGDTLPQVSAVPHHAPIMSQTPMSPHLQASQASPSAQQSFGPTSTGNPVIPTQVPVSLVQPVPHQFQNYPNTPPRQSTVTSNPTLPGQHYPASGHYGGVQPDASLQAKGQQTAISNQPGPLQQQPATSVYPSPQTGYHAVAGTGNVPNRSLSMTPPSQQPFLHHPVSNQPVSHHQQFVSGHSQQPVPYSTQPQNQSQSVPVSPQMQINQHQPMTTAYQPGEPVPRLPYGGYGVHPGSILSSSHQLQNSSSPMLRQQPVPSSQSYQQPGAYPHSQSQQTNVSQQAVQRFDQTTSQQSVRRQMPQDYHQVAQSVPSPGNLQTQHFPGPQGHQQLGPRQHGPRSAQCPGPQGAQHLAQTHQQVFQGPQQPVLQAAHLAHQRPVQPHLQPPTPQGTTHSVSQPHNIGLQPISQQVRPSRQIQPDIHGYQSQQQTPTNFQRQLAPQNFTPQQPPRNQWAPQPKTPSPQQPAVQRFQQPTSLAMQHPTQQTGQPPSVQHGYQQVRQNHPSNAQFGQSTPQQPRFNQPSTLTKPNQQPVRHGFYQPGMQPNVAPTHQPHGSASKPQMHPQPPSGVQAQLQTQHVPTAGYLQSNTPSSPAQQPLQQQSPASMVPTSPPTLGQPLTPTVVGKTDLQPPLDPTKPSADLEGLTYTPVLPLRPTTSSTSADELLSASPEADVQGSLQPKSLLVPTKVDDDDMIVRRIEDIPYNTAADLMKFKSETEAFHNVVASLLFKEPGTLCLLDTKWKQLSELQEKHARQQSTAIGRCSSYKNRFQDILPYDQNRIVLAETKDDYVNASLIDGISHYCPRFIATQSPLPSSCGDFWTMVYEQQVNLIVMLVSKNEVPKKCAKYWPEDRNLEQKHGPLSITFTTSCKYNSYIERTFTLKHSKRSLPRSLTQLQYTAWPEHGLPASSSDLMSFLRLVNNYHSQQRSLQWPILVHCENGVGHTGTFCASYACIQELDAGLGIPDILDLVEKMRMKRKFMIREKAQLKFIHDLVYQHAVDLLQQRGVNVNVERPPSTPPVTAPVAKHISSAFDVFGPDALSSIQASVDRMTIRTDKTAYVNQPPSQPSSITANNPTSMPPEPTTDINSLIGSNVSDLVQGTTSNQQPATLDFAGVKPDVASSCNEPDKTTSETNQVQSQIQLNQTSVNTNINQKGYQSVDQQLAYNQKAPLNTNNQQNIQAASNFVDQPSGGDQAPSPKPNVPSLLDELTPESFTLGNAPASKERQRFNKSDFFKPRAERQTDTDPGNDPFADLDPMWGLKK
ncbi:tyrosine-protein phosphatase non-receptor type 23-like isoform X2 [Clavelina lepadiformis]|uniref:tyrosine-protein phosphatase non-receptor type 23-like isoform X2 n=1 Tax=Clavelina lepadiformis TaxID=159417 RepID=UPI0040431CA6